MKTRKEMANPHAGKSFYERLKEAKSVDLRNNLRIIYEGNGYSTIEPVDADKRWGDNVE